MDQYNSGFTTGVANMGGTVPAPPLGWSSSKFGGGDLSQSMGRAWGKLKMLSKNTREGVHLIVKLAAISLQASKFTKYELLHTYFSRILARFYVIIYCAFLGIISWKGVSCFNGAVLFFRWGALIFKWGMPHEGGISLGGGVQKIVK